MHLNGKTTDISFWNAMYDDGKIVFNTLRHITYCKYESINTRPHRFFMDEVFWEEDLYNKRR